MSAQRDSMMAEGTDGPMPGAAPHSNTWGINGCIRADATLSALPQDESGARGAQWCSILPRDCLYG